MLLKSLYVVHVLNYIIIKLNIDQVLIFISITVPLSYDTHCDWARSGMIMKLLQEWTALHGQINLTGDDMNIMQVGRPAVSRYHQHRKCFLTNMILTIERKLRCSRFPHIAN